MKGYAQVLLRRPENVSEWQHKILEAIDRGSGRIDGVVRDLLDISKLQAGQLQLLLEEVDVLSLASEVVDRLALTAPNHHLQVGGVAVRVPADRNRLEQVLVNLLYNAIKFSPRGGNIDLSVAKRNGWALVSVSDQGVGIPEEKQRRIFQRFYRAHDRTRHDYGGMGVGLYISREIVRRHGGEMCFESQEGKGSTFYVALPDVAAPPDSSGL